MCAGAVDGRRRSIRLPTHDYAWPGAYFVTICTEDRDCLLGEIAGGQMRPSKFGVVVHECWVGVPKHFANVGLDVFVVMPNHLHGIVLIGGSVGATHASPLRKPRAAQASGPRRHSLGAIVGSFKSAAAKRINELRAAPGQGVWQRNYFEHVIRNEASLDRIREYICSNPLRWACDPENPFRQQTKGDDIDDILAGNL